MTELSPAARAVLDAAYEVRPWMVRADSGDIAAAALRAVVDCLGYDNYHVDGDHGLAVVNVRDVLALAAELEGQ